MSLKVRYFDYAHRRVAAELVSSNLSKHSIDEGMAYCKKFSLRVANRRSTEARNQFFGVFSCDLAEHVSRITQSLVEIGPNCFFDRVLVLEVVDLYYLLLPIAINSRNCWVRRYSVRSVPSI